MSGRGFLEPRPLLAIEGVSNGELTGFGGDGASPVGIMSGQPTGTTREWSER